MCLVRRANKLQPHSKAALATKQTDTHVKLLTFEPHLTELHITVTLSTVGGMVHLLIGSVRLSNVSQTADLSRIAADKSPYFNNQTYQFK